MTQTPIEKQIAAFHKKLNHRKESAHFFTASDFNLQHFIKFRMLTLLEEAGELADALGMGKHINDILADTMDRCRNRTPQDVLDLPASIDALADSAIFAIGSLDLLFANSDKVHEVLSTVMAANMQKESGINKRRPNPLGLSDAVKPAGWKHPNMQKFALAVQA